MGEYADDQIRRDQKRMFGFCDDHPADSSVRYVQPIYARVQCPHCKAKPKERGLRDHIQAVHPETITKATP